MADTTHTPGRARASQSIREMKQAVRDMQSKLGTPHTPRGTADKGRAERGAGAAGLADAVGTLFGLPPSAQHAAPTARPHGPRAPRQGSWSPESGGGFSRVPSGIEDAADAHTYRVLPAISHSDSLNDTLVLKRGLLWPHQHSSEREARIRAVIRADDDDDDDDDDYLPSARRAQSKPVAEPQLSPEHDAAGRVEDDRRRAKQFLMEARAILEGAREVARTALQAVQQSVDSMKEIKAATDAHCRHCEREARAVLEAARQKRLEEDRDQKSQIDDLYLRTRAAASTIKERAEAEFRVQETLRAQYMAETESMLARSREELEAVVRESEDVVLRAESRLKEIKADAHSEELRKSDIQADMHAIVKEAHSASSAAWAELNNIKGGVHSQCRQPVDDVLRVLASAQAVVCEIEAEQKDLVQSQSRGLELNAKAAMRYAVRAKQLRKHLFQWTLATNRTRFQNISFERLMQLPALSVRMDDGTPVQSHVIHQMQI